MDDKTLSPKLNLAILIGGRGSNMMALIDSCRESGFPARMSVVVSHRAEAAGIATARAAGVPVETVDHRNFADKAGFESALLETLEKYPVDIICLAGFMRILSAGFVAHWPGKILNIHPSLLPDYKGLDTHARVLADGRTESGCTVHFVTPALDDGEIILQRRVPVLKDDTPETLAARVLEQEHRAYPEAIRMLADRRATAIRGSAP